MRQGNAQEKEKQEKQKQQQLEDSSKWSLRKPKESTQVLQLPKDDKKSKSSKKSMLRKIQSATYDEIYEVQEETPGRHSYGSFIKEVSFNVCSIILLYYFNVFILLTKVN